VGHGACSCGALKPCLGRSGGSGALTRGFPM
jgi:hypothetical protein